MMSAKWRKRLVIGGGGALLFIAIVIAMQKPPASVDMAEAVRGPLTVTIDDDGKTRVREAYVVSAPVGGRILRIDHDVGDAVVAGETVLARIEPSAPTFLDQRSEKEAKAQISAAKAALALAESDARSAMADRDLSRKELRRIEELARTQTVSEAALDRARTAFQRAQASVQNAQAAIDVARYKLESAEAMLIGPDQQKGDSNTCCLVLHAPVSGRVLQMIEESETVVGPGAPLVEVGDPKDLEIVVDLLSSDAVKVEEGAQAHIVEWGGPGELNGVVRRVEPFGFTKISALGVEEQRVNVIIDLTDPIEKWRSLGHGYRIEAEIVEWSADDVLKVPAAALFRDRSKWALFKAADGEARLTYVEIGHANDDEAEVLSGLNAGDMVILHPGGSLEDGSDVKARP